MRVIFLGSPEDVIPPLEMLVNEGARHGCELVGVVSQPPKPAGRGGKMADPPVAVWAKERALRVLQPISARSPEFLEELRALRPDLMITAAYGQILSNDFLAIPTRGTINIHPSLLPAYRGAIPVNAALLDGCENSGVTILFTVQKLDAGNMIAQRASSFLPNETAGEATKRLFGESVALLGEALGKLKDQTFQGEPQDESRVTHCRKLKKEDGAIDWSLSAREILNRWRGLTPWPGIYSKAQDKRVTILGMERVSESDLMPSKTPGATHYDKPRKRLLVACGEGCVGLIRLQWEGGKPLAAADFWNGVRVKENFQMESIRA